MFFGLFVSIGSLTDLVSMRLLAYAGFDPHSTVKFWESKTLMTYRGVEGRLKRGPDCGRRQATEQVTTRYVHHRTDRC